MPSQMDWELAWPFIAAAWAFGYVLGSIPFGLVLTRLAGLGDIRKIGSGNIGATNVLRTGNKPLAALTLILDGAKGAAAVLIVFEFYGADMAVTAGAGAMLGHLFPVWLRFRGGKGVATALGVLLAVAWPAGLIACAIWLAAAALFRYSSLAALIALAAAPVACWLLAYPQAAELALFIAVLSWWRHLPNIRRLIRGEEPRIGRRAEDAASQGS